MITSDYGHDGFLIEIDQVGGDRAGRRSDASAPPDGGHRPISGSVRVPAST